MSVCGYIRIYLGVYGPENNGGFGLEEKTKEVCSIARTNYGGFLNVRPTITGRRRRAGNKALLLALSLSAAPMHVCFVLFCFFFSLALKFGCWRLCVVQTCN